MAGCGMVEQSIINGRAAQISLIASIDQQGTKVYHLSGQLFFGSAAEFITSFDYQSDPDLVAIDYSHAHIWDYAAAEAITKVIEKYQRLNKQVLLVGLEAQSYAIIQAAGTPTQIASLKHGARGMKEV
jgi:sulfate permease, SulP family